MSADRPVFGVSPSSAARGFHRAEECHRRTEHKHSWPGRKQMLKPNQLRSEATSSFSLPALTSVGCKEIFVPYLASGV